MIEVEAKFSVPDRDTFDELRQLAELAGYRLESTGVKWFRDRYLDTYNRAILHAGYACRVRENFAGSEPVAKDTGIVTLKGLGGADATSGIHQRAEYEVPVAEDSPTTWPVSTARDLALQLSNGQPLLELFRLSQERHLRLLLDEALKGARRVAELSLDVVTPEGVNSQPYYELELELLDHGTESDLHILVGDLKRTWGLRPEPRSKFERGLDLGVPPRQTTEERNRWQDH